MSYNSPLPQSTAGPIYTDRPTERINNLAQSWAKPSSGQHHLNPSKSKINVRTFLNKTGQNICVSHPSLENIRGSCYLGNPPKPNQSSSRDNFNEEKFNKSKRISQEVSTELISKENFPNFTFTPVSGSETDERKRSDSSYLRSSLKENSTPKKEEDDVFTKSKEQKAIIELRSQIFSLTKKVFMNQEEISKLKEKKDKQKDKKWQSLQQEFTQFQIQMFDICKKNTNYFSEFQSKIEKNNKLISQVKSKYLNNSSGGGKQNEKQDLLRKIIQCQSKIADLNDNMKVKEDLTIKNMASQLNMEETMMKKYVNQQVLQLKNKIDKSWSDKTDLLNKIDKIQKELQQRNLQQFFKKDKKKSLSSTTIQRKQIITIKQNEGSRQKTGRSSYKNLTPRKQFEDLGNQNPPNRQKIDSISSKTELIVKQSIYYIDPLGYILDQNKFYLLNSKNEHILLPQRMLNTLRDNNMLVVPSSKKKQ